MQRNGTAICRLASLDKAVGFQAVNQPHRAGMRKIKHLAERFERQSRRIAKYD
mgnify:CR=1 FL=1